MIPMSSNYLSNNYACFVVPGRLRKYSFSSCAPQNFWARRKNPLKSFQQNFSRFSADFFSGVFQRIFQEKLEVFAKNPKIRKNPL